MLGQVSHPGVDQNSLTGPGRTPQDGLPQQGGVFGDGHGLELGLQGRLLAGLLGPVDLVHDALEGQRVS